MYSGIACFYLARLHGHEWGDHPSLVLSRPGLDHDTWAEHVNAVVRLRARNVMPGISRPPKVGETHSTLTGRVQWTVTPQGVTIAIRRPAGIALQARVTPCGVIWGYPEGGTKPEERHYAVLLAILNALTGETRESAFAFKGWVPLRAAPAVEGEVLRYPEDFAHV